MAMGNNSKTSPNRRAPSIAIAFRTLSRTVRHGYENAGTLAIVGLLWLVGALLIVPLGPATAGLHRVLLPATEARALHWRMFFAHLRADLRWSSVLAFTLLVGFIVFQGNIGFYNAAPTPVLRSIALPFWLLLVVWTGIALYAFPLALRQQDRRLRTTLRNALVMVLANGPGVLVSFGLLVLVIAVLAVLPPLFVLIPGVVALWGQENARLLLIAAGYVAEDEIADRLEPHA